MLPGSGRGNSLMKKSGKYSGASKKSLEAVKLQLPILMIMKKNS
jgi:hypothetical protein